MGLKLTLKSQKLLNAHEKEALLKVLNCSTEVRLGVMMVELCRTEILLYHFKVYLHGYQWTGLLYIVYT